MRENIKIGNNALIAESSYIGQDVVIGHHFQTGHQVNLVIIRNFETIMKLV